MTDVADAPGAPFADRLADAVDRKRTQVVVGLDPVLDMLPVEHAARISWCAGTFVDGLGARGGGGESEHEEQRGAERSHDGAGGYSRFLVRKRAPAKVWRARDGTLTDRCPPLRPIVLQHRFAWVGDAR